MNYKGFLICCIWVSSYVLAFAGDHSFLLADTVKPDIIFDQISEKDGLSHNFINDMLIDGNGYLWVGTQNGLNRFDGRKVEVFRRQKDDPGSILQNNIGVIAMDKDGQLWFGSIDGLSKYQPDDQHFVNYKNPDLKKSSIVLDLVCDDQGLVWFGNENGLTSLNPKTYSYQEFPSNPENIHSLPAQRLIKNSMVYDKFNRGLWLATYRGLCFFDLSTHKATSYLNQENNPIYTDHPISALFLSKNGELWFFDNETSEITSFDVKTQKIGHRIDIKNKMANPRGGYLFESNDGQLWYSSDSYEIIRIDLTSLKFETFRNDASTSTSIAGNYIASAVQDADGAVWLGTVGGISKYNYKSLFYRIIKSSVTFPELEQNWKITCLAQDPASGNWWIGTYDGMIYIYNPGEDTWVKKDHSAFANAKHTGIMTDIDFINHKAVICFGNSPPYQIDLYSGKFSKFEGLHGEYSNQQIQVIVQETDSTYLFGNSIPILRWNSKTNDLKQLSFQSLVNKSGKKISTGWLSARKNKGAWLALSNEDLGYIHLMDTIIYPVALPIGTYKNMNGYFNAISVDEQGDLWFSIASQGVYKVSKKTDRLTSEKDVEIKQWQISDGLTSESILSVIPDKDSSFWFASFNRFSVYDQAKNQFRNFKVNLAEYNPFYFNYSTELKNGNLLFNIRGDLVEFIPTRLQEYKPQNHLTIGYVQLQDKKILLSQTKKINLEPNENFLKIGFGTLSSVKNTPYKTQYMLQGVDHRWMDADESFETSYTSLSPGDYHFKVRNVAPDGSWQSEIESLQIHIKAPFYKTWWFIALSSLITLGLIYYFISSRLRTLRNISSLKSKTQLLEKEKTTVMYENLRQHLNPHFLFNSLTSLSSLIRIDQKQAGIFLDNMSKVYRYILRNKDQDSVALSEELGFVNLYIQLQKTRLEEGLEVVQDIPDEYLHRRIAPVTLQNLVENAIKHNIADRDQVLVIKMYIKDDYFIVENNLQKKNFVETSNRQGLSSMVSLYQFLSSRQVEIEETNEFFRVKIPLL